MKKTEFQILKNDSLNRQDKLKFCLLKLKTQGGKEIFYCINILTFPHINYKVKNEVKLSSFFWKIGKGIII